MKVGCQFLQARWAFKPRVGHCVARQFTLHQRDPQSDHHIARRKSRARPNCINPPSFHRFLPKPVIPKGTFPFSLFHSRPICTCYLLFVILIFDLLFLIFDFWFLIFWFLIFDLLLWKLGFASTALFGEPGIPEINQPTVEPNRVVHGSHQRSVQRSWSGVQSTVCRQSSPSLRHVKQPLGRPAAGSFAHRQNGPLQNPGTNLPENSRENEQRGRSRPVPGVQSVVAAVQLHPRVERPRKLQVERRGRDENVEGVVGQFTQQPPLVGSRWSFAYGYYLPAPLTPGWQPQTHPVIGRNSTGTHRNKGPFTCYVSRRGRGWGFNWI